jgi:hypothetical protein
VEAEMNRNIYLPLLTLLLACGTAQASDWVSLGKTDDGKEEGVVDVSSIRVAGAIRWAWVKFLYAPRTHGSPEHWWASDMSREAFNCADETHRREALTVYYEDGTNGSDPAANYPTQWQPVLPDTIGNAEMQFICAWGKK